MKRFCLPLFLSTVVSSIAAEAIWEIDTLSIVPPISEFGYLPGQGFRLEFSAPDGPYGVRFSADLTAGSFGDPVAVTSVGGTGTYLDASALGRAKGFYQLEGAYRSDAYHWIIPAFAVERYQAGEVISGDLVGEVISKDALLEYRNEASGGIVYDSIGFLFQQYLSAAGESIVTYSGFTSDLLQASASFPANGLAIQIPAGAYDIPYGDATRLASVQDFGEFETDRSVLAATELVQYSSTNAASNEGFSFTGSKIAFPFLIKKSLDADASDLNGDWGVLNLTVEAFKKGTDTNQDPTGPVAAYYGLYASVGAIQATDSTAGNLNITRQWDFEVVEDFGDPYSAIADSSETLEADQIPFNLAADGSITLSDEFGEPISGAVSPSASVVVATRAFPDNLNQDFNYDLGFSDQSVIVAVKRDTTPSLAGKSYRLKTFGFFVNFLATPGFEIFRGNPEAGLAFSANGATAILSVSQNYHAVSLEGGAVEEDYDFEVPLNVEIEPDGTILLSADDLFGSTRMVGFAQQGGDAMVMANTYQDDEGFYELGLMILTEE